jgi:hypothetical protein
MPRNRKTAQTIHPLEYMVGIGWRPSTFLEKVTVPTD